MGSYTLIAKNQRYLSTVETKSHIAEFVLNDLSNPREDSYGVQGMGSVIMNNYPPQFDKKIRADYFVLKNNGWKEGQAY